MLQSPFDGIDNKTNNEVIIFQHKKVLLLIFNVDARKWRVAFLRLDEKNDKIEYASNFNSSVWP